MSAICPVITLCIAAALGLSVATVARGAEARPTQLAIRAGTLIDVRTGTTAHDMTILVVGDRITQVGRSQDLQPAAGARVLDAKGRWIVAGFIDMHVHVSTVPDVPLELYVAKGVTAIRDMGGNLTALRLMRESSTADDRVRPRLFFAGAMLDGNPPSAPRISIIADSPQRARSAVHFLVDQGVDAIKVYNGVDEPALQAVVRAAAEAGVPVVGHVPRAVTAMRAVQLGMDGIEHSPIRVADLLQWRLLSGPDADRIHAMRSVTQREAAVWQHVALDAPPVRALLERLAGSDIFFDPTLSIDEYDTLFLYDEEALHPNNRYLTRSFAAANLGAEHDALRVPPEMRGLARAGLEKRRQFVLRSHQAGVTIVAGTDGPGIGSLAPGFGLHRELALLVDAGLTPLDAIRAATINAARALRQDHALGTIEPGRLADLVMLTANPLDDIGNSRSIDAVILGGRVLDRAALDGILSRLEAAAKTAQ